MSIPRAKPLRRPKHALPAVITVRLSPAWARRIGAAIARKQAREQPSRTSLAAIGQHAIEQWYRREFIEHAPDCLCDDAAHGFHNPDDPLCPWNDEKCDHGRTVADGCVMVDCFAHSPHVHSRTKPLSTPCLATGKIPANKIEHLMNCNRAECPLRDVLEKVIFHTGTDR